MIRISDAAQAHFAKLLANQEEGTQIRVFVINPGTPNAECGVSYCPPDAVEDTDTALKFEQLTAYVDELSAPYLEDAEIDFVTDQLGSQLTLKAPNAKMRKVADDGIAMGLNSTVRGILDPLIELYRPVPPLAYLPLMVIWFGIGETSKILLIYLAIFAPVAMSALAGVKSAQQVRIRAARSLGASRAQVLWLVILPGALPEILTGLRIGLGVGWSTLVAAELIAATRGLGFMVQSAGEFLATDVVLAGIAVIAIIAFLLELGLRALQRRLTPWHGEVQ